MTKYSLTWLKLSLQFFCNAFEYGVDDCMINRLSLEKVVSQSCQVQNQPFKFWSAMTAETLRLGPVPTSTTVFVNM